MTEFTGFLPNPVPGEPSPESVRLRERMRGARKGMARIKPGGLSLALYRLMMNTVALRAKAPEGGYAKRSKNPAGVLVGGPEADPDNGILLWVHGGGLVSGSPQLEQGIAAAYAEQARIPAFLPRYRLAPEHRFPAAADDVLAAYRSLLDQGYAPEKIRVGGGSAGGSLVLGLLGDLGREGLPLPAAVLLMSPMLQLSAQAAIARDAEYPDPGTDPDFIVRTNLAYAGDTPLTHPRLDHLALDMTGWPPILVQTGELECIVADAQLLGAAMRAAGGRCEVQLWPGQGHYFTAMGYQKVPEARLALDYGAAFLAQAPVRS